MTIKTFKRIEKKILIDTSVVPQITQELLRHMNADAYNIDGKPYEISNIYFDNDGDDIIRHSISKPSFKQKLRIRSYGVPKDDSVPVFIELKKKFKGVVTKRRATLPYSDAKEYIKSGYIPDGLPYIDRQVLHEVSAFIEASHAYPKVYISYMRCAFFGKEDKDFRVTFDYDIIARHDNLSLSHGREGIPVFPEGKALLEVKFSEAPPMWFAGLMSKYGLSFHSYSKYGTEFENSIFRHLHSEDSQTKEIKNTYQEYFEI